MIYTILIKCVDGMNWQKPFERTVEIESGAKLNKLHQFIQALTDFDDDHCYDFFIGKTPWDIRNCLGQGEEMAPASPKLKKITLEQVFPLPKGQKFFYWFDFGDDWKFEIALKKSAEKKIGIKYPRCIAEKGPKPEQYPPCDE